MNPPVSPQRMDRRAAIKWMLTASFAVHFLDEKSVGLTHQHAFEGYGTDPNLLAGAVPWERTMTPQQLRSTAKLADIILPRTSQTSPSATEVHVPDFIDEWISAPYPSHQADREMIIEGLSWIDRESRRRFNKDFHQLSEEQSTAICDDICYIPEAPPELEAPASSPNFATSPWVVTTPPISGQRMSVTLATWPSPPSTALLPRSLRSWESTKRPGNRQTRRDRSNQG